MTHRVNDKVTPKIGAPGVIRQVVAEKLEVAPARNGLVYIWGHLTALNDSRLPPFGFGQRRYPELDNIFVSQPDRAVSQILDTAIANVSLPHIAGSLATSYDESTWVLTSYLVANAVVHLSVVASAVCSAVRTTIIGG